MPQPKSLLRRKVAIVFVNNSGSEGRTRIPWPLITLRPPAPINQDALVSAVALANSHTIVVIESGGPVLMPWLGQVSAVLEAWFPAEDEGRPSPTCFSASSIPQKICPLDFRHRMLSYPAQFSQPPDYLSPSLVSYTESYNVAYKWFDSQRLTPLFPFGFGLSYTTFSITNASPASNLALASSP